MMIEKQFEDQFLISVTANELIAINNCLNEVCHGIAVFEFETRIGARREDVAGMLGKISAACRER